MDSWSKYLFYGAILLTVLAVSATFYKTVILHQFEMYDSDDVDE